MIRDIPLLVTDDSKASNVSRNLLLNAGVEFDEVHKGIDFTETVENKPLPWLFTQYGWFVGSNVVSRYLNLYKADPRNQETES